MSSPERCDLVSAGTGVQNVRAEEVQRKGEPNNPFVISNEEVLLLLLLMLLPLILVV